jgi:hypothetical protein
VSVARPAPSTEAQGAFGRRLKRAPSLPRPLLKEEGGSSPWALAAILTLAGFLRLFSLQYGQYGSDDERLWTLALRSVAAHTLPLSGIRSSIGVNNGPFQAYIVMPAAALFGEAPIAGAIVVALLNTLAVYFLYRFVREFFGRRPALIATLLFAVNSWAVIYARRMQAQDMLVPFQILFFWNGARWLARGRWWDLVLMFVWLALLTQVYVLGFLHLASAAIILLLGWRKVRPGPLLAGVVVWAGLSAPYAVSTLLPGIGSFGNVAAGGARLDAGSLVLALTMATHKGFQTIAGQAGSVFDSTSGFEGMLVWAEEALFALGVLYALWSASRAGSSWKRPAYAVLLVWALVPVAAFARHAVPLYPYYFVALLPLPAVFTGLLLDRAWAGGGGAALLGLLSANALAMAGIFFAVIPGYWTKNDYGLPYAYTFDLASRVQHLAAQQGIGRVYVDGDMDPSEVMSSVLLRHGMDVFWLDDYRTPEFAAARAGDPPSLYLTMADDTDTSQFLRQQFGQRQTLAVPLPGEGVTIRGYELSPPEVRAALDELLDQKLGLNVANGLVLDGFYGARRLAPGQPLRAALSWEWPGGTRPQERYTVYAHLVDGSGKAITGADYPLQPTQDWAAGQEVVQWFDLPVPAGTAPGRYRLEAGFYGNDVRRQQISGVGDELPLGPFVVPPPQASAPPGPPKAELGDGVALAAHQALISSGELRLMLTWLARAQPSKDYTVFVHVLDGAGQVVAQADSQPRGGDFPTSVWQPGDVIEDSYRLSVPPGHYTVEAGMYYLPTLERLGQPVSFAVDV